jgi:hypothetical protein
MWPVRALSALQVCSIEMLALIHFSTDKQRVGYWRHVQLSLHLSLMDSRSVFYSIAHMVNQGVKNIQQSTWMKTLDFVRDILGSAGPLPGISV